MKTKQFTIGYNWVVTIHEEYSLFKDLANEFKYSVVDSDNETITIFTVSNSHVDFEHTSYNLHPVVGFDDNVPLKSNINLMKKNKALCLIFLYKKDLTS
ncbi:Uncharacterised protein [Niallia circulans]|nr:Uncharacterised protein [Niallia circulans]